MSAVDEIPDSTSPAELTEAGQRMLLRNVGWDAYQALCEVPDVPALRLTFDRGNLELTTPSHEHEVYSYSIGGLVGILAEELNVAIKPGGATTLKHPAQGRGLEPDQCFWITHERQVRTRRTIDLTRDLPPDLFIEIEVTRSLLDRLAICAALQIPEVWRVSRTAIQVLQLLPEGGYAECEGSQFCPGIPLSGLLPFLRPNPKQDYLSRLREFRQWVREQ